ncbi:MAG: YqaJ viral recombinase family protein [Bacteroidales bacterium]|nr:YqaJ viral recombinase family protein [Bacteroidales bacterium]
MRWVDSHIEVAPNKKPKKITATRFATILGLNPWSSAFEVWCEITKTYQKPFEDTIYTIAGKTIEPKQIAYMRSAYGMYNLKTPSDIYGEDYFKKTWGDFFHDTQVLGGMWDSLLVDENGKPEAVLEFKTTKRAEDWANDVPEYYALQAALYAYLLGVDDVIMIASFLEAKDYEHPENFTPSASNTITVEFKVSERYPNFNIMVNTALYWWEKHVVAGISPDFDEKKDAEILKALRTNDVSDTTLDTLIAEAESLKKELEAVYTSVADKEKQLKAVTEQIKQHLTDAFTPHAIAVEHKGGNYVWSVSKTTSSELDKDAMKADGVFHKYLKIKETYRMTTKSI